MTGRIKKLHRTKGFGFIQAENGKDLFFHRSNVMGVTFESLEEGMSVTFTVKEAPKGPRAEQVQVVVTGFLE